MMTKGRRDPLSNLYILNLTQRNNLMAEFLNPDGCFAGNVHECKSKVTLVDYHHASCWSPTQFRWVKPPPKNFFTSWPGLSSDLVLKYFNKKQATTLRHLQQPRKGPRNTQKKQPQKKPEPEPEQFPPSVNLLRTNIVFLKTVDLTGNIYIN